MTCLSRYTMDSCFALTEEAAAHPEALQACRGYAQQQSAFTGVKGSSLKNICRVLRQGFCDVSKNLVNTNIWVHLQSVQIMKRRSRLTSADATRCNLSESCSISHMEKQGGSFFGIRAAPGIFGRP